jgi:hypothetical protein
VAQHVGDQVRDSEVSDCMSWSAIYLSGSMHRSTAD